MDQAEQVDFRDLVRLLAALHEEGRQERAAHRKALSDKDVQLSAGKELIRRAEHKLDRQRALVTHAIAGCHLLAEIAHNQKTISSKRVLEIVEDILKELSVA